MPGVILAGAAWLLFWLGGEGVTVSEAVGKAWGAGAWMVGDRARWMGVTLVCCRSHHAKSSAEHPWDADGMGSDAAWKQACLWAPDGDVEAGRLAALMERAPLGVRPERLRTVALLAAGHARAS